MKVKVRCYLLCSRWRQRAELWGSRWIFQSLYVLGAKQSTEKNKPVQRNLNYLGDLLFGTAGHSIISISAWEISILNSAFLKRAKWQASHEGGWRTIFPLSLSHWAQKGAETFVFHCLPVLDPGLLGLRHNPAEAGVEARPLLPTVAANVLRRGMLKFCIS